ncbi:MAG: hypothetical protein PHI86_01565 [Candidatus Omnitrophica bacterium]|nr:hypothetical protein [Candidatus Omnitrophota bacterium]
MIAKAKLGQSILGFTFAFIIIAALSIGLTRIWAWYNINFGSRQVRYQASRPTAASPGYYGGDEEHPNVYITHAYNPDYKPIDLTEQWVFRGATTERTPYEMPPFGSLEDAANVCKTACPECVTSVPDPDNPGHTIDTIDVNCPCYVRCMCDQRVAVQIQMYNEQMKALRDASCSMIREAEHMEDEAERCDDPWELCWWGGFGVPSKKLRDAARSLRQQAARLCNYSRCCGTNECCGVNSQVGIILRQRNAVSACCDHDTQDEQDICLADIAATQCGPVRDGYIADWNESIRLLSCERSFAIYIRNTIDNMYGRPAPDRGCQKWADYQCRYACEVPEVAVCEQEVRDGCTTDCQAYCTTNCTCIPPTCDPPVFDAACYADCEANQCVDNGDGHIDTWYEVCVNDRMTDPALPQSYNNCIAAHIAACVVACPGSAEWNRNYEQCCQSFCCSDCCAPNPPPANCAASTPCGFGVLDRRYWSYNRQYRIRPIFGDGWECIRNCDCCPIGSADGCTWVTPGRIGDGCITTWQARYPEWATYATWCGEAANRQDRWWGRSCTSPSTFCDADCEDVSPPPAACFVAPTVLQPSGIVVNPSGLAMCGSQ